MSMQAAEKRRQEQEKLKAARIQHIVECSFGLFAENGIESITMNQIAEVAEIGVATLYRYFTTKEDLAIEVAVYAWKMEEENFKKVFSEPSYAQLTGYQQMAELLSVFPEALASQSPFFRFIYYFDSFVKKESVSPERLQKYEGAINGLNMIVIDALQKGEQDGSISYHSSLNKEIASSTDGEFYFTVMHSLFSLCQKLALSGEMLFMDRQVSARKQIELMVNIILESLK